MLALILLAPCLLQLWFFLHTANASAGRAHLVAPLLYAGLPLAVLLYGRYGMAATAGELPQLVNVAGLVALVCGALLWLLPLLLRRRGAHD